MEKELQELKMYLKKIEDYTLLAAKNVLCFDDVALLAKTEHTHPLRTA